MARPDYQSMMLPLLQLASDGKEHQISEATAALAKAFNLTEDERFELLPSGLASHPALYFVDPIAPDGGPLMQGRIARFDKSGHGRLGRPN